MSEPCIVVGASHAGVTLALQLRREGWQGPISLIDADPELPYHRPPLSKDLLSGERDVDAIRLRPEKVYADNNIDLLTGKRVASIDRSGSELVLEDGARLSYRRLALCTGSEVCHLPGVPPQQNVLYLRTVADVMAIKSRLDAGKRAVIVGGGYIGLETAAVLRKNGLQVTLIEAAERVLARVTSPDLSAYVQALHERHGVSVRCGSLVAAVETGNRGITVHCSDGGTHEADFIIAGIGVSANTGLAEQAGLAVDNGVVVDEYCTTSDPAIFAAGDCTRHPNAIYQKSIRLESVQNANDQARVAAANICGKPTVYDAVPWFWSDQYDHKFQMVGLSEGYDNMVCRGEADNSQGAGFALFYFRNDRLIAADCVSRPREFMASKQWVKQGVMLDAERLADDSVAVGDLLG